MTLADCICPETREIITAVNKTPDIQGKSAENGWIWAATHVDVDGGWCYTNHDTYLTNNTEHPSSKSNHHFRVTPSADNILPRMTAPMIWYLARIMRNLV